MRADRTEVSWDSGKSKWMVKISVGEEVIRRYCDLPQSAGENELRTAAQKTLQEEGFDTDAPITIQSSQAA
jgi:hypothetical protein